MSGAARILASTPNQLLDLRAASQYSGISRSQLYRLVKRNAIAHVLLDEQPGHNHRIYFRMCDLDAWIESRVRGGAPADPRPRPRACGPLKMPARKEFS